MGWGLVVDLLLVFMLQTLATDRGRMYRSRGKYRIACIYFGDPESIPICPCVGRLQGGNERANANRTNLQRCAYVFQNKKYDTSNTSNRNEVFLYISAHPFNRVVKPCSNVKCGEEVDDPFFSCKIIHNQHRECIKKHPATREQHPFFLSFAWVSLCCFSTLDFRNIIRQLGKKGRTLFVERGLKKKKRTSQNPNRAGSGKQIRLIALRKDAACAGMKKKNPKPTRKVSNHGDDRTQADVESQKRECAAVLLLNFNYALPWLHQHESGIQFKVGVLGLVHGDRKQTPHHFIELGQSRSCQGWDHSFSPVFVAFSSVCAAARGNRCLKSKFPESAAVYLHNSPISRCAICLCVQMVI